MQLITLRLDRVFDVVHGQTNNTDHTLFSFESAGRRHFSVALPGRRAIREGVTVTALLEREDDWQTLLGWREHDTGEVVYDASRRELVAIPFAIVLAVAAVDAFDSEPGVSALLVVVGVAIVAGAVLLMRKRLAKFEQLRR